MRACLVAVVCLMALAGSANTQPSSEVQPSCDLNRCISICQADKLPGDDCPALCSKVILVCTQIVADKERTRFVRRKPSAW
jgi:hypothetical protein